MLELKKKKSPFLFLYLWLPKGFRGDSLVAQLVENPPEMQETPVRFLGPTRSSGEGVGYPLKYSWASLVAQMVKNPPAMRETWVWSPGWEDPWRRAWQPTPVFLPGESHGQRSLAGYSRRGRKELDTSERLSAVHHKGFCICDTRA